MRPPIRGYFLPGTSTRFDPGGPTHREIERCWGSPDNEARRRRARELPERRGVNPMQVALAWVQAQLLPTIPIVGPRRPEELRRSLEAVAPELDEAERDWLEWGPAGDGDSSGNSAVG